MFSNQDYKNYFSEIEDMLKTSIVLGTDLLNELNNQSVRSKIHVIASEDFEIFQFIRDKKEQFK